MTAKRLADIKGEEAYWETLYDDMREQLLVDPKTPYWMKEAIVRLDERTPEYAYFEVNILQVLSERRLRQSLKASKTKQVLLNAVSRFEMATLLRLLKNLVEEAEAEAKRIIAEQQAKRKERKNGN